MEGDEVIVHHVDMNMPEDGDITDGHMTADEMDEKRKQSMAYEYLCHLEEAKKWMEACLEDELPETTVLEENLQNGVYLAKLGHHFAPDSVPLKRIYDITQKRYNKSGLHYRHTDNVVQFFGALDELGLPQYFHPDTSDVYDRKNMPKLVYCIHALSQYLHKLGKAALIQDLYGKVEFTEEEISSMRQELEKYGIQMPSFAKIGGILAKEMPVDDAAIHAAVVAINDAIEKGVQETLVALQNPIVNLNHVLERNAEKYHDNLQDTKQQKIQQSMLKNSDGEKDMYDEMLTKNELQNAISQVNVEQSVKLVNDQLRSGDVQAFYDALSHPASGFPPTHKFAATLYFDEFQNIQNEKQGDLSYEEVCGGVKVVSAVASINKCLREGSKREALLSALLLADSHIESVNPELIDEYMYVLSKALLSNQQRNCPLLSHAEVQECIDLANGNMEKSLEVLRALSKVNRALVCGEVQSADVFALLSDRILALTDLNEECQDIYAGELIKAVKLKIATGDEASGWLVTDLVGGSSLFYDTNTDTWTTDSNTAADNTLLTVANIQAVISATEADHSRQELFLSNEESIVKIQSAMRMARERKKYKDRLGYLQNQEAAVVKLQSATRGYQTRQKYKKRLDYLNEQGESALKLQSFMRMFMLRKRYKERLSYLRAHEKDTVKIQAAWRGCKAKNDYQTLMNDEDKPLRVVRTFAHLLDQSDKDYHEEQELQKLRQQVVSTIRSNQKLEADLSTMDIKIGLLVKNRITLDEVVSMEGKLSRHKELSSYSLSGGLSSLNKESRERLDAYQHLFYRLQVHPQYLAKLLFTMPQQQSTKFIESVVLAIYNYASSPREEYLLLKLFATSLQEEIQTRISKTDDIIQGNPLAIKMAVDFHRSTRGHNYLKDMMQPLITTLLNDKTVLINTNPVEVYKAWVNQTESETGKASGLPYDVTNQEALKHAEVQQSIEESIQQLRHWSDQFLDLILTSLDCIPYGMRYIAKVLYVSMKEKFTSCPDKDMLKVIGNFLYYRYINSAIAAPDAHGILDLDREKGALNQEQRRNLGSIAKILQFAAANKGFGTDSEHLTCLNTYIKGAHEKFKTYFREACDIPEPEVHFNIDPFSDAARVSKPEISLRISELLSTHEKLLEYEREIAPENGDVLHELLKELGTQVPTIAELVGEDDNTSAADEVVQLTLSDKFELIEDENSQNRQLLSGTKRMVIDVIRCSKGDSLEQILSSATDDTLESRHNELIGQRKKVDERAGKIEEEPKQLTLAEKKTKLINNMATLEQIGLLVEGRSHQTMLNLIAKDIKEQQRYRLERRKNLQRLSDTMKNLQTKRSFFEAQREYYKTYVSACLANLTTQRRKNRSSSYLNAENSGDKKSETKKQAVKYNGAKLHEKGIILEIEGLPKNQFKAVQFEISTTDEAGVFECETKFIGGLGKENHTLRLQDLLQLQYEGVAVMQLFERAKVNVNLLIFFLNKKFYGTKK